MASKGKITEIVDIAAIEKQLKILNDGLGVTLSLVEKVSKEAVTMSNSFKESKGIKELTSNTEKLNKEQEKSTRLTEKLKLQNDEYGQLSKKLKEAHREALNLGIAEGKNSEAFKKAAKEAKGMQTQINDLNKSMGRHQGNVGNYRDAWNGLVGVFTKVISTLAAAGITFEAFKKVMNTTEAGADKLKFMMAGVDRSIGAIYKTIATGDWSNLLNNMQRAYDLGVNYTELMDRIEHREKAVAYLRENEKIILQELDEAMKNKGLSDEQRLAAAKAWETIQKQAYDREKSIAQQTLDAAIVNIDMKGKEAQEVRNLFQEYLTLDALNPELRKNAEEYNKLLEKRKGLIAGQNQTTTVIGPGAAAISTPVDNSKLIQSADVALASYNDEVKQYAELLDKIEGTKKGERINIMIEAMKKMQGVESAYYYENRRNITMKNRLEAAVQENNQKTTDDAKTELEKRLKAESDFYNSSIDELNKFIKESKDATDKIMPDDDPTLEVGINALENIVNYQQKVLERVLKAKEEADKLEIEKAEWKRDKLIEIGQQTYDGIMSIVNVQYANQLAQIDQLAKADEESKQKELKAAGDNANAKNAIEAKYLAKEKDREAERIKIKMKQDKANKAAAMIKVIIDTALGIVSALSSVTTAFMAPIIAAQGAIQLGVIAATPLPKYFKGREGGPAEFAMVGERGREAIQLAGGETFLTPDKPTVTWLPEHAKVITNEKLMQAAELAAFKGLPQQGETKTTNDIQIERLIDAINNKKEYHINLTEKGLQMAAKRGQNITEYLNRNVRI